MKKRVVALMLMCLMIMSIGTVSAREERSYNDPFDNDLFEVVTEIKLPPELLMPSPEWGVMFAPSDFKYYINAPGDNDNEMRKIEIQIDYEGNVTSKEATGSLSYIEIGKWDEENISRGARIAENVFNDGLAYTIREEESDYFEEYFAFQTYRDMDGNEIFEGPLSFHSYDYNLGLMQDFEFYVAPDGASKSYTYYKKVMTDGAEYAFSHRITAFNDDGYAILDSNPEGSFSTDNVYHVIKLKQGIIPTVFYNGEKIRFDQIPVIEEGRTLVPLRAIFEKLGAEVSWNGDTRTVKAVKGDIQVELTVDDVKAKKNGEIVELDVPAKIVGGRTLVPVRFVSDCFDVHVDWDETMKQVVLTDAQ